MLGWQRAGRARPHACVCAGVRAHRVCVCVFGRIHAPCEASVGAAEITAPKSTIQTAIVVLAPPRRTGLHNELCALKWKDPTVWQREGFQISAGANLTHPHRVHVEMGAPLRHVMRLLKPTPATAETTGLNPPPAGKLHLCL